MALDLGAIRERLERLKNNDRGEGSGDSGITWRPKPGDHIVRVLPWQDQPAGEPFVERDWHYNLGRPRFVALESLGQDDPVRDLRISCFNDKERPEMREAAKKLFPRKKGYAAIIVRGEEDKGPRLMEMNKTTLQEMIELFFEEDVGDYTDLQEGFDLKITVTEEVMLPSGNKWFKLKPSVPRSHKPCPAAKNKKQLEAWLTAVPNVSELYQPLPYAEVKGRIDAWLKGGGNVEDQPRPAAPGNGSSGASSAARAPASKPASVDLDDAFAELESDLGS